MLKSILLLAAILLAPAPAWAGAGNIGEVQLTTMSAVIPIEMERSIQERYFAAGTGLITIAGTTETPIFLFVNVSTNTLKAYLQKFRVGVGAGSVVSAFKVYRAPVVTSSGTSLGVYNGNTGSSVASQMQAFQSPVVSSNGTLVYITASESGGKEFLLNGSRIFTPGKTFLVTVQNNIVNIINFIALEWWEE